MPTRTANSEKSSVVSGVSMMPRLIRIMLIAPSVPSIGRHAMTRIRNEVQNGMTQMTSSAVCSVWLRTKRPMKSATG